MKAKEMTTQTWSNEHGVLYRTGIKGKRYFIDTIGSAFEPDAGKVYRNFATKEEYDNFDPDDIGELVYHDYR